MRPKALVKQALQKGEWEGQLTRFISRLETKIADRRYGFMFSPPASALEYGWLQTVAERFFSADGASGIKIIDFSEVPPDVLPIVTGVFARLLYDIQFWMAPQKRRPISVLTKPTCTFQRRTTLMRSRSRRCGTSSGLRRKDASTVSA